LSQPLGGELPPDGRERARNFSTRGFAWHAGWIQVAAHRCQQERSAELKHLVDPQTPSIASLPAALLRDNCPCPDCRDPVGGQRLIAITDLAPQLSVAARRAANFPVGPPSAAWADYEASDATRLTSLRQLLSTGFMLLRGVPPQPGAVLTVASSFGYVRETNYGKLFDVRVEPTPANLAFTGLPIGPHTDNPYRDPAPTVQLLHCLVNAADGGESGLLDGFTAAAMLRAEDPWAFDCLTTTPVTFRYADVGSELSATRPIIGLTANGLISEIRYNSRSLQPPSPGPRASAAAQLTEFYRAYRTFAMILLRPELTLRFSLEPGDCIVFDNTRLMHSRTGFAATGQRHLQGCYADIDGVESTVAVLARGGAR
jgi:gamma-butyrobetaine dioxygenase